MTKDNKIYKKANLSIKSDIKKNDNKCYVYFCEIIQQNNVLSVTFHPRIRQGCVYVSQGLLQGRVPEQRNKFARNVSRGDRAAN